jgi:hypothetical protein
MYVDIGVLTGIGIVAFYAFTTLYGTLLRERLQKEFWQDNWSALLEAGAELESEADRSLDMVRRLTEALRESKATNHNLRLALDEARSFLSEEDAGFGR